MSDSHDIVRLQEQVKALQSQVSDMRDAFDKQAEKMNTIINRGILGVLLVAVGFIWEPVRDGINALIKGHDK